jgi:transcriptional regulator with XRE-family HTH domain
MERVAQQFMRSVRGSLSQQAFARRLGYRANPVTDWEHGRRYPTVLEALRAAARVKIDVLTAFQRFQPDVALTKTRDGFAVAEWLRVLCAQTSVRELAERGGVSRFALGRWLSGQRTPRLPDFFRVVDAATARLPDLLAALVPIENIPALAARHAVECAARTVAFEEPWSEAVLRVLETPEYRSLASHRPGLIAQRLAITLEQEQRVLARLEAAQVIELREGHYHELRPLNVDTRGGKQLLYALKRHWADTAALRAEQPLRGDLFAYSVISVSAADLDKIRHLLHETYREIRSVVAASQPAECVALLNLQLVGWNGEPAMLKAADP